MPKLPPGQVWAAISATPIGRPSSLGSLT